MALRTIRTLLARELRALRREVEAYPDDESPWHVAPGTGNSGGTLVLHLAGNLKYFVGAALGGSGYVRDREAEFSQRGLTRAQLVQEIDETMRAVDETLSSLPPERLDEAFPIPVAGRSLSTTDFLMHLVSHLGYHLGQVDYHRRMTTGVGDVVGTVAVAELAQGED